MHIKICEICGKVYESKRSDSRFCSVNCRQRNHHMQQKVTPVFGEAIDVKVRVMDTGDLDVMIRQAHQVASDLSFASLCVSGQLAEKLSRVAQEIELALRKEGL